ncbi:hypothetical protein D7024_10680 [Desulfofundulus salinus]|uniref:Uncharacterized protein n=1 Tax=Desulfofundulus salinus TaxID=2419843 RepID=A0A494WWD2_9FIRM|nr:hypothetical protein D7024_10680 [Desulfofundulus salinum]
MERAFNLVDKEKVIQPHHLPAHLHALAGENQLPDVKGFLAQVTVAFRQGKTLACDPSVILSG